MADTTLGITLQADPGNLDTVLKDLEDRAKSFGSAIGDALSDAIVDGESLAEVLAGLGGKLAGMALDAGMKPLEGLLSQAAGSLFAFADGGVPGRIQPFADGGIVARPTFFPMGRDLGLMGEAGTEAIMPLKRGPDGKLGVGAAASGPPTSIVVNSQAQDVDSFARSQGQVASLLARTVGRGRRGL